MATPPSPAPVLLPAPRSGGTDVATMVVRLAAEGQDLEANNRSGTTRRAYEGDFEHFAGWCATIVAAPLPASPETVYLYLAALVSDDNASEYSIATLDRRLAAITYVHEINGYDVSPARHVRVRELMTGIRRTYGQPQDKRDPLTTDQLAAMVGSLDLTTLSGKRDRAVLLVGYAGALRRSELAGLSVVQLARWGDGYLVHLGRTKSDQVGEGRLVGVPAFEGSPLCPVAALDAWLAAAAITSGPVFRKVTRYQTLTAQALIVKRTATAAGIQSHRLAGHSLRSGHATTASTNGASDRLIMAQTGHKSVETLEGYIRPAKVLADNSARYLDLGPR